jgi:threonine/homoserine/homoserine lactone efflux protein
MNVFVEGVKIGLIVCFMLGPMFFALLQASIEHGFRAGATLGLGLWTSDLIYIVVAYWGLAYVERLVADVHLTAIVGLIGGVLLIIFGAVALWVKPNLQRALQQDRQGVTAYWSYWIKGFLLNIFNPFTFFFWLGIMSTVLTQEQLDSGKAPYLFGGIIGTIMTTDLLKVLLAKKIRRVMRPVHILWLRRVSGIALIIFGVALIAKSVI